MSDLRDYQGQGTHPAIGITWHDAQAFTQRLNDHFGEDSYRLPTEAEWEYACRAGTTTQWFFGDDESLLASYAWYEANSLFDVQPVGAKLPNPWGLFDMYGNAHEWVYDWFGLYDWYDWYGFEDHDGTPQIDPSGSIWGYYRIQRGGSYIESARVASSAMPWPTLPEWYSLDTGVRLLKGTPLQRTHPHALSPR